MKITHSTPPACIGGPKKVSELTGRKSRLISKNGEMVTVKRSEGVKGGQKAVNIRERERFQNGDTKVAIISEAASAGAFRHIKCHS